MKRIAVEKLIPQRAPVMMVDELLEAEENGAEVSLLVRPDNYFMDEDGRLDEVGLIEHIAQSASALAGYKALAEGVENPPLGYIGEVKRFKCHFRPCAGNLLHTTISVVADAGGVTLIQGVTRVGDRMAAETQMKIFVKPWQS